MEACAIGIVATSCDEFPNSKRAGRSESLLFTLFVFKINYQSFMRPHRKLKSNVAPMLH
ncbi:hypothetical protein NTGM5_800044 [Candidatus Nitrotoga sp. M5]|nr:hypothetical protein NTGM5_800044 [Candidatus Nitrotoga sp. M5]